MVVAGFYLFSSVRLISITHPTELLPAFLCILLMPVTGSITDGIIFGLSTYVVLTFLSNALRPFFKDRSTTDEGQ